MGDVAAMPYDPRRRRQLLVGDLQRLFLDAGRIFVLGGWLVATYSFGNPAANPVHVFVGFVLLLLGVFLLTFSPAAYQFPWVARAGAAVANAVLNHLVATP